MKIRSSQQAFDDVKRFGAMFPGMVAVFQDMAQVASIETLADAAEKRLADANARIEAAKGTLAALADDNERKQQEQAILLDKQARAAADDIAQRSADVDAAIATKQASAQQLLADASKKAEQIVLTAQNAASAVDQRTAAAQSAAAQIDAMIAEKQAALGALNQQITAIEQHKATLAAALAATG